MEYANLSRAWAIERKVIFALFLRELKGRFGRYRLSYFWAIAEPLAFLVVLSAVRVMMGRSDIAGLPFPVFFAAGLLPFFLFTHIVNNSLGAIESTMGLLNYQRVKPADALIAKIILEVLVTLVVSVIFFGALYYVGYEFRWNSTLQTLTVLFLAVLFACGIGFAVSIIGPLYQDYKKVIPVIIRPFFFISGIFFAAESLPDSIRDYALLNPLLQVSELFRMAMFQDYTSQYGDMRYLAVCSLFSFFVGLAIYRINRVRVVTSGNIR